MNKIVLTPQFKRAYKKIVKHNPDYQRGIDEGIRNLEKDIFNPSLETHKLSGKLLGSYACSCGYNCRIIFEVEKYKEEKIILLITIGTHDEVY